MLSTHGHAQQQFRPEGFIVAEIEDQLRENEGP